jgi:hypothetical protein
MLGPLTTRRLYPVSSYDTEVVFCVVSRHGGCILCRLTTRRLYSVSSHDTEDVFCVRSPRGGCVLERLTTQGRSRAVNAKRVSYVLFH